MKYLLFSGSLRKESLNKKLVNVAASILSGSSDHKVTVVDLKSLSIPVYDGDVEAEGMPRGVTELGGQIGAADAIVISSPEYNGAIAGSLKNTIDWVSRLRPTPFAGKPIYLMGASTGYFGAIRALGSERGPFERLGAYVHPDSFALPMAGEAFTPEGDLKDAQTRKRLETQLANFATFAKKLI